VDPFDADKVLSVLDANKYNLVAVINTHEHFDHIRGNKELAGRASEGVWAYDGATETIGASRGLKDDEIISFGAQNAFLQVIYTPGHTMKHICLLLHKDSKPFAVLTGDTVFNGGVGNCRSGDPRTLFRTVEKLDQMLADEIVVYPGHDYTENNLRFTLNVLPDNSAAHSIMSSHQGRHFIGTMADERRMNLFFMCQRPEVVEKLQALHPDKKLQTKEDVFLLLRSLRDHW
jgi:hydroxyacylglutathione hydrolase